MVEGANIDFDAIRDYSDVFHEEVEIKLYYEGGSTLLVAQEAVEVTGMTAVRYQTDEAWQQRVALYNCELQSVCARNGAVCVDTSELFADIPAEKWRFDNIHMTPFGNDLCMKRSES